MDPNVKKTTLRMIPYGMFVLTAAHPDGRVAAATINWVTQASFEPPLVAIGVKADSHGHALIKETKAFALNVLGKGQQAVAFTFFKPAERQGQTISGEPFRAGTTGAPILTNAPAYIECTLEATVEKGDHSVFVGKVVDVGLSKPLEGRFEDATLWLKELGDKVYYGG
jgi:flavin reductase (DIM6/NTAB) family NADH-FMN oxidoreductase RutF